MQNGTCYILAMIKRDDGERLLLGAGYYEFTREQKHFAPNQFQNDIVELQGTDGQLLAGQVRRSTSQPFDGYIGDGTTPKDIVEQKRREFFLFFRKQHHYTVVYIMPDGSAIKRDRGYITDAPAVQELYQVQPKWHVALAFEDVNYYSYAEDDKGNEIYSFDAELGLANIEDGGLIFDTKGAISTGVSYGIESVGQGTGNPIEATITSKAAQFSNMELLGETSQNGTPSPAAPVPVKTVTGFQKIHVTGANLFDPVKFVNGTKTNAIVTLNADNSISWINTTADSYFPVIYSVSMINQSRFDDQVIRINPSETYTLSWKKKTKTTATVYIYFADENRNGITNIQTKLDTSTSFTFTAPANAHYMLPRFAKWLNQETDTLSDIMLTAGTRAIYEPFTEKIHPLNLGKNLLDPSKDEGYWVNTSGTSIGQSTTDHGLIIKVNPNTSYTVSTTAKQSRYRASWTNSTGATTTATPFFVSDNSNRVFTGNSGSNSFLVVNATDLSKIQVEIGDKATPFVAYFEPIELCKLGEYQDRIFKDGDSWKIRKNTGRFTFETKKQLGLTRQSLGFVYSAESNPLAGKHIPLVGKCSHFDVEPTTTTWTALNRTGMNSGGALWFRTTDTNLGDTRTPEEFAQWLVDAGVSFVYALETTTTTTITDKNLIHQLDAIASARLEHGANTITATSESLGATMDADWIEFDPSTQEGGYVWAPSSGGGPVIVTVNGVDSANPVWHVYGPATNPTLTNSSTGEALTWNNTVPANQELIIDMGNQTATLEGANVFEFVSGSWIQLKPGQNRISYTAANTIKSSRVYWNEVVG